MSEVVTEVDRKQDSPYGWLHPNGWRIGRYLVSGVSHFMHGKGTNTGANSTGV